MRNNTNLTVPILPPDAYDLPFIQKLTELAEEAVEINRNPDTDASWMLQIILSIRAGLLELSDKKDPAVLIRIHRECMEIAKEKVEGQEIIS